TIDRTIIISECPYVDTRQNSRPIRGKATRNKAGPRLKWCEYVGVDSNLCGLTGCDRPHFPSENFNVSFAAALRGCIAKHHRAKSCRARQRNFHEFAFVVGDYLGFPLILVSLRIQQSYSDYTFVNAHTNLKLPVLV